MNPLPSTPRAVASGSAAPGRKRPSGKRALPYLRVVLATAFATVSLLIAAGIALLLDRLATEAIERDIRISLVELGRDLSERLDEGLYGWLRNVEILASLRQLRDPATTPSDNRAVLDRLHQSFREIAWIGIAAPDGRVQVAMGGILEGDDVAQRPWFKAGVSGPYVGDVHDAQMLARLLPMDANGEPLRFVDVAAPIFGLDKRLRGVLGVHLSWNWARQLEQVVFSAERRARHVEVFVVNGDWHVVLAPNGLAEAALPAGLPGLRNRVDGAVLRWSDGGDYVTGVVDTKGYGDYAGLGWKVVVRQPKDEAYAPARHLQWLVISVGLASAVVFALFGLALAGVLARPLTALTRSARLLAEAQDAVAIPVGGVYHEARELSESLRHVLASLSEQRRELAALNASLEAKVLERTALLDTANRHLFSALEERGQLIARLEALANTDSLTGLLNRRALFERVEIELRRVQRQPGELTAMILDIDYFKRINDGHGHAVGDEAIRQLAKTMKSILREVDIAARFGGEEFVAVLIDSDLDTGLVVAERLRQAISALSVPTPAGPIAITASIGVAEWQSGVSMEAVISRADEALYQAKYGGRNRVVAWAAPST